MRKAAMKFVLWAILLALWILLTLPFTLQELYVGAGIAFLLILLPLPGVEIYSDISLLPKKIFYAFLYFWVFLWAVVRSNLDVAYRVLHPKLLINPGIVKVHTKLTSYLGRLVLANSITLTPGTITVDIEREELYIHWLNIESPDIEENTKKIVGSFERYLEVIFG